MDLSNIINGVLFRYPLFGNIIVNLEIRHTSENVPAPAFTDGRTIYYKDEFLTDFDDDEKEFIIAHEIFHIVLSHLFRNIGKDQDLLNYVEDAIINQLLIRDGMKMPEGLVFVKDALDYSVEELYMRFLPKINRIKSWMVSNTYHITLGQLGELFGGDMQGLFNQDLQELMSSNQQSRGDLLNSCKIELQFNAEKSRFQSLGCGSKALGIEFPACFVGTAKELLRWQDILEENLKVPDDNSFSFYEVQMDGIIKKETRYEEIESESEIIVDSSASMDMEIIKAILRECKNILSYSNIKVGFCDVDFYGWHDIRTSDDIDNLQIIGRGGTSFRTMANSFSGDVDNRIVITDGLGRFPSNREDILWIIIGHEKPPFLDDIYRGWFFEDVNIDNLRYIFIDERDIIGKKDAKRFVLEK